MYSFFERLKRFPKIKKFGRKMITIKECYFRIIADDDFYREYQKNILELPECSDGPRALADQYVIGNMRIVNKPLRESYQELWGLIEEKIKEKKGFTLLRVGDGEANFLNGVVKGNTATRHFTTGKIPDATYIERFKEGLIKCDSIHIELYKTVEKAFKHIYKRNVFSDIPLECVYALVASRKIFKSGYRVGIIGSEKKIAIIKELFSHQEYCEYIGRNSFEHYIPVPERGTSNDVDSLYESIRQQLDPAIDIYLVGIGIAKLAILHKFKETSKSVFIDVGCGISALSGFVSNDRPYFADWVNFRLKNFDYSQVDTVDAVTNKGGVFLL